jgi:hypothetical protein
MMMDSFYNSNPNLKLKILRNLILKFSGYIAGAEIDNTLSIFGGSEIQNQIKLLTDNKIFESLVEKFKNQNNITSIEKQIIEKFTSGQYGSFCAHDLLCNPSIYTDIALNSLTEDNYNVLTKGGMIDALSVIAGDISHAAVFPGVRLSDRTEKAPKYYSMKDVCAFFEYQNNSNKKLTQDIFNQQDPHIKTAIVEDFNNAEQGIEDYIKSKQVLKKGKESELPDIDLFVNPEENTNYVYKLDKGLWYTRDKTANSKKWIPLDSPDYKKSIENLNESYKKQLKENNKKTPTIKKEKEIVKKEIHTVQSFAGFLKNNPQRLPFYAKTGNKKTIPAAVNNPLNDLPQNQTLPNLTSFIFRKPIHNRGSRNDNYLSVFFGAVSPLELSRCTPYLSLTFYTKKTKGQDINRMDSTGYMRFDDGVNGLFSKTPDVEKLFEGKINSFVGEKETLDSVNYMDMFLSPQTMVNANINNNSTRNFNDFLDVSNTNNELIEDLNNVLDPFAPMLTLKSFNATINSGGDYMITNRRAKLSMTLHDRSRLNEIAPFVSLNQVAKTLVKIEHGWSHPDGNLVTSNNDIGKFLNSLRESHVYMLTASDFSFSGNQIDINMTLDFWGASDFKSIHIAEGNYKDATKLQSKIIDVISDMESKNIVKSEKGNHQLQQGVPSKAKKPESDKIILDERNRRVMKHVKIIRNSVTAAKILLPTNVVMKLMKKIEKYSSKNGNDNTTYWHAEILIEYFLALANENLVDLGSNKSGLNEKDPAALIDLLDTDNSNFINSFKEFEIKSKKNLAERLISKIESMTGIEVTKQKDGSLKRSFKKEHVDPFTSTLCNVYYDPNNTKGLYNDYPEGHISLGKVISNLIALPMSATNNYDEVQILFYPINNAAAGARKYTTASLPVEIKTLKRQIYKVIEGAGDLTPRGVFDIISNYFQDNNLSIYKLSKDSFGIDKNEKEKEIRAEPDFNSNVKAKFESLNPDYDYSTLKIAKAEEKINGPDKKKIKKENEKIKKDYNRKQNAAERSYIQSRIASIRTKTLKDDLNDIYNSDNLGPGNLTYFKKPVIHMELEVMPKIVPAPSQAANAGNITKKAKTAFKSTFILDEEDITKIKGIDNTKKILKIHVYDENATSKPAEAMFMDGLVEPESFFPIAGILNQYEDKEELITLTGVKNFRDASSAYIEKMSIREIKQFVSRAFPTIRYGSQQGVVKSVNVSSNTSDEIINSRLMNAFKKDEESNNSNITKTAENTGEVIEEFIIPTSIDMAIYGCPFITMGLNVFVDMQTGTDIDNVYMVGDVSHSISAGEYSTTISLYLPQIGTGRDMRSRLIAAAENIDKEKLNAAAAEVKQKLEEEKVPVSTADADAQQTLSRYNQNAKKEKVNKVKSSSKKKPVKSNNTLGNVHGSFANKNIASIDSTDY